MRKPIRHVILTQNFWGITLISSSSLVILIRLKFIFIRLDFFFFGLSNPLCDFLPAGSQRSSQRPSRGSSGNSCCSDWPIRLERRPSKPLGNPDQAATPPGRTPALPRKKTRTLGANLDRRIVARGRSNPRRRTSNRRCFREAARADQRLLRLEDLPIRGPEQGTKQ